MFLVTISSLIVSVCVADDTSAASRGRQRSFDVLVQKKKPPKTDGKSLNDISMEIAALQAIDQFQLTAGQLAKLKDWAKETSEKPRKRVPAKTSKLFRQKLEALHKVLKDGGDADELQDEVDELREKENPTLDDDFDLTAGARRRAPELCKQLKAGQLNNFLSQNSDEIADPLDKLLEALAEVREWKEAEWKDNRDGLAHDVAVLVAGVEAGKFKKTHDQVIVLLNRARALKPNDLKQELAKLEASAEQIAGHPNPLDVLRHFAEHNLAELLSNPRLDAAVRARLKH